MLPCERAKPIRMPNMELKFSLSDLSLALVDELRGTRSREDLLRQVIELGLCELVEATSRTQRDYTNHLIAGTTKDYKAARRAMFSIDEPEMGASRKFDTLREVTAHDHRRDAKAVV